MLKNIARGGLSLLLIVCSTVLADGPSTITLDELKQTVAEDQNLISTAHIVWIREETDNLKASDAYNAALKFQPGSDGYKINHANQYIVTEEDIKFDSRTKTSRQIINDLRDINVLLAESNIPDTEQNRYGLDTSREILTRGDDNIWIGVDSNKSPRFGEFTSEPNVLFAWKEFAKLGVIPEKMLNRPDIDIQMSPLADKGLLKIEFFTKTATGTVATSPFCTIVCDPSIRYRIRTFRDGNREIILDDYRNVNGTLYPFSYIKRTLKPDKEEKVTIKEAAFGVTLSEDDFKTFVPKGILIGSVIPASDHSERNVKSKTRVGKRMGMGEIRAMCDETRQLDKKQHPESQL
ncbi:MAG: hypothetical protein ABSG82_00845 [Sedimentisphaerales bacterium]|jgi:hypothetical protein